MAEENSFGGAISDFGSAVGNFFTGNASPPAATPSGGNGTDVLPDNAQPTEGKGLFGSGMGGFGPPSYEPKPQADPLDQAANLLQQRIDRAQAVGTNPLAQIMNPEGALAARNFVPQATEALLKIKQQKATIAANKQEATNLGLAPGDVPDEATREQRVTFAQDRALKGDLKAFKGLQAVDPKAAEAIAPQVQETVAGHLTKAQYAFDKLSSMSNQGEYAAALRSLEKEGALSDLQAIGLKVPGDFAAFSASKGREGQALREARIGINDLRTKLEERNTYQPMGKDEAETYKGRLTTAYGDQITNGAWSRNAAAGTRGLIVNGASDPRQLGKTFTLASPEQRKAVAEEFKNAVPVADIEKDRAFNRIYKIATTDAKGKPLPADKINTNPNVQQGIAEGLASALRGGSGGATSGLLNIETSKRGVVQGVLDSITSGYAGALNTISEKDVRPYLTKLTQSQIRDVMDALHSANANLLNDRVGAIAERAGALGLDATAFGLGKEETNGAIGAALERGRAAQVERMLPYHQAIGGGDGVFQLGAQRPGTGGAPLPPGTGSNTQLPAPALQTPLQQSQNPASPPAAPPGGGGTPPGGNPASAMSGNGPAPSSPGGGAPVQPVQVAGQSVSVALPPGASPAYVSKMQRIESGDEKDPWTAGTNMSSASGAFQFINSTWAANKPPGAPARAKDATPEQQAQALATFTNRNAATLRNLKLPVNDTTLYIAHNLGAGGAGSLMSADPGADARQIVGEDAAKNNPLFFKGRPTVATVLQRYQDQIDKAPDGGAGPSNPAAAPGKPGESKGLMQRVAEKLGFTNDPEQYKKNSEASNAAIRSAGDTATEFAPAIGSTAGAVGGAISPVPGGAIMGGAAGGAAGQMLKDYIRGNKQSPSAIGKEAALGAVFSVGSAARPVLSAAARMAGGGAVEAGAKAVEGGDAADVIDAGVKGSAAAAGGEAFGRALGMAGHKVWTMFAPDAREAVQSAAAKYSDAEKVLSTEASTLPSVGGSAGGPNPKYAAAETAKREAEVTLKDAGIKPEEAAYAHKVASESVPKQEAQLAKPGALEEQNIGKGYQQLESEVGDRGVGAPKAVAKLPDGPIAAVENKQVAKKHTDLAQRTEMAITSPAPDWQTKWTQLKDVRSALLEAERDAMSSTATGRSAEAKDMRVLADSVRKQQEKVAKIVFGDKDGEAFMTRLKVLDVRYRNLMEATNGGDLAKAASMKGEAGRDIDRKFKAFAMEDKDAIAAWDALRRASNQGHALEQGVHDLVAAERIPVLGKVFSAAKLLSRLGAWRAERAAGSPASFADILKLPEATSRPERDLLGTAAQRSATMSNEQ
jgi:hypothetical protein